MTRHVIIAPILSGKTTLMRSWAGTSTSIALHETDEAERASSSERRAELKALRHEAYASNDWSAYNSAWHTDLAFWTDKLDPRAIILAHSLADARVVGEPTCYVLIPRLELRRRMAELRDDSRYDLAIVNRMTVEGDALAHPLQTFDTMEGALLYTYLTSRSSRL